MKISNEAINEAYRLAKLIYQGEISQQKAVDELYKHFKMNRNSAKDYLLNFKQMKDGIVYKRCNNAYATDYFLKNLYSDYGANTLANALQSVSAHINYYEKLRNTNLRNISELHHKYSEFLLESAIDLSNNSNPIEDLDVWPEGITKPDKVNRNVSTYRRNDLVRQTVILRAKGCCEYCGNEGFIILGGNRRYLETHHIIALASDGEDKVENVIALCPGHHREAHFGTDREVLETEMLQIVFSKCKSEPSQLGGYTRSSTKLIKVNSTFTARQKFL